MSPEERLRRVAELHEELAVLNRVPPGAGAILDRELERLVALHTEKCCDLRLTPLESAMHKEARAMARALIGFFEKRKGFLKEELRRLRTPEVLD